MRPSLRDALRGPLVFPFACFLVACVLAWPGRVAACATCACGDPTLTVMGSGKPFQHRLRISMEFQHRTDAFGEPGVNQVQLSEQRINLAAAYAPTDWLMLSLSLPLMRRQITQVNLAQDELYGVGDTVLRARGFFYMDREVAPRHLLAGVVGLRIPTAALDVDASGAYLDPELQAGTGSFDPLLGVSYSFFQDPWSVYVSEVVYIPTPSRADWRMGTQWRGTHTVQYQLFDVLALRLGANFRLEEVTRRHDPTRDEPDTGGFVAFLSPSLVVSPVTDLLFYLDVHIPVINALYGFHDEGIILTLGAAYDF